MFFFFFLKKTGHGFQLVNISQTARKVVFAGTFTAGGLEVAAANGKLRILHEGRQAKFIRAVEQVSFNSQIALENRQEIIYITERCVFTLTADGLTLTEIAPGIELERDILPHMEFTPIIREPRLMDERIFQNDLMGLVL